MCVLLESYSVMIMGRVGLETRDGRMYYKVGCCVYFNAHMSR